MDEECLVPTILSKAEVRSVDQAVFEVRFTNDRLHDQELLCIPANGDGETIYASVEDHIGFVTGLQPDASYGVYTFDPCGDSLFLGTLNEEGDGRVMDVSDAMYIHMPNWTVDSIDQVFRDYVRQLAGVSTWDKAAVIQEHLYSGRPFVPHTGEPFYIDQYPIDDITQEPYDPNLSGDPHADPPPPPPPPTGECLCKIYRNWHAGRWSLPNVSYAGQGNSYRLHNEDQPQNGGQFSNSNAYWNERFVYTGPAKEHYMGPEQTSTHGSHQGKTRGCVASTLDTVWANGSGQWKIFEAKRRGVWR